MSETVTVSRDALLTAALAHVAFDGWTTATLRAGARDAGLAPDDVADAFPRGVADAVRHFSRMADSYMLADLEKADLGELRIHARVALAITLHISFTEYIISGLSTAR